MDIIPRLSQAHRASQSTREGAMSGPNTSYDPVQVTPLSAESIDAMVAKALAAFAAATSAAEPP